MKVIVVLEVDPDGVIEKSVENIEGFEGNLKDAIENELQWCASMYPVAILEPDEIHPNDQTLGEEIRKSLI